MPIRRILVDVALDLGPRPEGVEVDEAASPLGLGGCVPSEVLVVTAERELLAEAGGLGVHRIVSDDPDGTAEVVRQFVEFLGREPTRSGEH